MVRPMAPPMMAAQRMRAAEVQRQMSGGTMLREAFPGQMAANAAQQDAMMREFMARQQGAANLNAAWGGAQAAAQQQQMQAAWAAQQMGAAKSSARQK